jgi:hypothetical protein
MRHASRFGGAQRSRWRTRGVTVGRSRCHSSNTPATLARRTASGCASIRRKSCSRIASWDAALLQKCGRASPSDDVISEAPDRIQTRDRDDVAPALIVANQHGADLEVALGWAGAAAPKWQARQFCVPRKAGGACHPLREPQKRVRCAMSCARPRPYTGRIGSVREGHITYPDEPSPPRMKATG